MLGYWPSISKNIRTVNSCKKTEVTGHSLLKAKVFMEALLQSTETLVQRDKYMHLNTLHS